MIYLVWDPKHGVEPYKVEAFYPHRAAEAWAREFSEGSDFPILHEDHDVTLVVGDAVTGEFFYVWVSVEQIIEYHAGDQNELMRSLGKKVG